VVLNTRSAVALLLRATEWFCPNAGSLEVSSRASRGVAGFHMYLQERLKRAESLSRALTCCN
jgi:hypothetical protein